MCVSLRGQRGFAQCEPKQEVQIARGMGHHAVVMNDASATTRARTRVATGPRRWLARLVVALPLIAGLCAAACGPADARHAARASHAEARGGAGFRTRALLEEHWRKHGREFGAATPAQYLAIAQALRDRPARGPVIEIVRGDGVVSRFDRDSGTFLAFDANGVIRTCFKPRDGERYFRRQADRYGGDR